jgi:Holliday junction resolvase
MNDTNPEVAALVRQKLLERSGAERIMMASGMFEAAKAMVLASFPAGLTEIEVKRRLVERIYGEEVDVEGFVEHLKSLHPNSAANQPPK